MEGETSLPEELKIKILLGLPVQTILRFKSVCKHWQSLIKSLTFATCYCSASYTKNKNKFLWFHQDLAEERNVISLFDCQTTRKISNLEWPPFLDGAENKEECNRAISILGPVNGVYCILDRLLDRWIGTLILWNPAIRDYKHIAPQVAFPFSYNLFSYNWFNHWYYRQLCPRALNVGFGFDNKTSDFKVIAICHWEFHEGINIAEDHWHVKVYNLSTDSWRTVHYIKPYEMSKLGGLSTFRKISSYPECVQCYLNGVLHWTTGSKYDILAFDVVKECFQLINGPPVPKYEYPYSSVWVYKETIAMSFTILEDNQYPSGALVWMMTEYGVEDSWTMLYSCGPINGLVIIGIPNEEQIFFSDINGQLISYNWEDQVFKEFGEYGLRDPSFFPNIYGTQGVIRYVETFVPLNSN